MSTVIVKLAGVGSDWTKPCQDAVKHLNALFKQSRIPLALTTTGSKGPAITVKIDASIKGGIVHGKTSARVSGAGKFLGADVGLPGKVTINTPQGQRGAGPGILEVIAAHEFVHALGHTPHNSHLMSQTFSKEMGNKPAGDKLKAGSVKMPPLKLAPRSVTLLKSIWK